MKNTEFAFEAERIINLIAEIIEEQDNEGMIDIDLNGDILNLTTDKGIFVINKQTAAKEIWLSSPISGPYHFALKEHYWRSRNGTELFAVLASELQMKFKDS